MTRDEIIRMAREAGLHLPYWDDDQDPKTDPPLGWNCAGPIGAPLERFAALVAAKEREECARVAAWILKMPENDVSAAIRERGMK
jgi:hypothetical protein